jgi:hypothetical protein
MPKKAVNAKAVRADIKAGMPNTALMKKYRHKKIGLLNLFKKVVDAGGETILNWMSRGFPCNRRQEIR